MLPHGGLFWPSLAPQPPQLDCERFGGLACDRVQYDKKPSGKETKLLERMASTLKDFEARQLKVDEDEQLEMVEEDEEDWDPQDELMDVERQASSGHLITFSGGTLVSEERGNQPWFPLNEMPDDLQSLRSFIESLQSFSSCSCVRSGCLHCGDDLLWRDPDRCFRKPEPDNGTTLWGDPEIANARPIRRWLVAEGEEEDLEDALARQPACDSDNEMDPSSFECGDSTHLWPFPFPKPVTKGVFTGWTLCNPREGVIANLAHPGFGERRLNSTIGTNMPCECMDVRQRNKQQDSLTPSSADFVDQLRSQASELQTVVTDIQNMINRASNSCPSQERNDPLACQSKEEEWERFAAGVKELKVTMARLQGNVRAEDEQRAIRERLRLQNNPFYDSRLTLFHMSLSGPRDTPLFD